ncbi:hypothetical protein [Methylosinus sp. Sm6]|uniref:hypothetical protein n=1 Tax=Methylosinus sp. Sm6 TaxID=2866948 RepID=UPI001C99FD68|nr:hypothetical protein [Methylosinus sp. Sm6]MBY6242592.1 hypothetical protein [Methylosinus sp. Sm6]
MNDPASDAPRWEWRIFGADLAALEARLGTPLDAPRRSDEIYLLNSATPHSAKIRSGALEVKRLLQVDGDGLELWRPAFRAEFPLGSEHLARAAAALALHPPPLRAAYDQDGFFTEVVAACRALRPVSVRKARRRYTFRGCAAEAVRVQIGAVPLDSVAVESADPARLREALRALGVDARLNVNFPKGVERAVALVT